MRWGQLTAVIRLVLLQLLLVAVSPPAHTTAKASNSLSRSRNLTAATTRKSAAQTSPENRAKQISTVLSQNLAVCRNPNSLSPNALLRKRREANPTLRRHALRQRRHTTVDATDTTTSIANHRKHRHKASRSTKD